MKFAKVVFWVASVWGVLVLTPLLFIFDSIGRNDPPPVTHPGFYYGFVTVALAFQFIFIVIATDPVRFRPMMILQCSKKSVMRQPWSFFVCSSECTQRIWYSQVGTCC